MRCDEFLARVRERGEFHTQDEAQKITEDVLGVLGGRISPGEVEDLASRLPAPLGRTLAGGSREPARNVGVEEFYRQVAERTGARPRTPQWDAGAVLSTVADIVSDGELDQVVSRLPAGYAPLFGKADPAG